MLEFWREPVVEKVHLCVIGTLNMLHFRAVMFHLLS